MTEDEMKPFVIVSYKEPVNGRQYATEADAIEDAMALAESSGYTYHVIKVCGTAVCHKTAHYHAVEMGGGAGARKKSAMNRAQTVQEAPPIEAGGA